MRNWIRLVSLAARKQRWCKGSGYLSAGTMENLHLEDSKMSLCSPRTADRAACPKERDNSEKDSQVHRCRANRIHETLNTVIIQKSASHWRKTGTSEKWCSAGSYHTVNQDTERNPEDEGKHHDWAHYVISQELPWWRGDGGQWQTKKTMSLLILYQDY